MPVADVLYTHSPGGSILSQHFVWRVPDDFCFEAALTENWEVIERLKCDLPVYHTRALRNEYLWAFHRWHKTICFAQYILRTHRRCKWS